MKYITILLLSILAFSCGSSDSESDACIDNLLEILDMEHYEGVMEGECRDYLQWFTYDGSDYFWMDNPCADYALHLWDCDNIDICAVNSDECLTIMANMTQHGIVGRSTQ